MCVCFNILVKVCLVFCLRGCVFVCACMCVCVCVHVDVDLDVCARVYFCVCVFCLFCV
jgi:hypothetical protein